MQAKNVKLIPVSTGWSRSEINTVIFRYDPISTYNDTQVISFFNEKKRLVLAKRKLESVKWEYNITNHKGKVTDAHNAISLIHDNNGYLHISFDHHNDDLRYCMSIDPESIILTKKMSMTNLNENKVCYPEFYRSNDIIYFFYRTGGSGRGNLNIKSYNTKVGKWKDICLDFIDGEGERNAYWQTTIDNKGIIHISWCWRETNAAETNHDICYAKSYDGGKSWLKSTGEKYTLPITLSNSEYIQRIPQKRELINTTSMATDSFGNPFIVSYYRPSEDTIPHYMLVYLKDNAWREIKIYDRTKDFKMRGTGTLLNPLSPPKILIDKQNNIFIIIKDEVLGGLISVACCNNIFSSKPEFVIKNLSDFPPIAWEPSYDSTLWHEKGILHLFVQKTGNNKIKELKRMEHQMVYILEWNPKDAFE